MLSHGKTQRVKTVLFETPGWKAETKNFKELFSNSKEKRVERKKSHKNLFTGSICSCILMMASVMY